MKINYEVVYTVNIYIDESGSINNKNDSFHNFVIALIKPNNEDELKRSYKRYISSHIADLKKCSKEPEKMFKDDKFKELKGSSLTSEQKREFVRYFTQKSNFSLYYIVLKNNRLEDNFCRNTARAFNYSIYNALNYFSTHGMLDLNEVCNLQLDERNERTDTRNFLENYLNTQFINSTIWPPFTVKYFDSSANKLVQLADVFANLYYSNIITGVYDDEIKCLRSKGILKGIYLFPYYTD